jgi:UDP-glucose 4-epimerase
VKLAAHSLDLSNEHVVGRKCLVLGAGGFMGAHLSRHLADLGAEVVGLGRGVGYPEAFDPRVKFIQADLADESAVRKALDGVSIIYHLAGGSIPQSAAHDSVTDVTLNVLPTLRLIEACRPLGPIRFIFASSGGTVYGVPTQVPIPEDSATQPISAYGAAKLVIEKYLGVHHHLHGLDHAILRIANPYGPLQNPARKQGLIGAFLHNALLGRPLQIWGTGEVRRDFIHIDDACAALIAAAAPGLPRVMNIGSGEGLSVNQIADAVERTVGLRSPARQYMEGRADDVPVNVLDISRIVAATGWRPRIGLHDGLRQTADWMQKQIEVVRQDG